MHETLLETAVTAIKLRNKLQEAGQDKEIEFAR